jgi:hypothetical protein
VDRSEGTEINRATTAWFRRSGPVRCPLRGSRSLGLDVTHWTVTDLWPKSAQQRPQHRSLAGAGHASDQDVRPQDLTRHGSPSSRRPIATASRSTSSDTGSAARRVLDAHRPVFIGRSKQRLGKEWATRVRAAGCSGRVGCDSSMPTRGSIAGATSMRDRTRRRIDRPLSSRLLVGRAQLGAITERWMLEDADRGHECCALLVLVWPKLRALGPPCELTMRSELQRLHLFAG